MTGSRLLLLAGLLGCLGCSGTEETPVYGPGPDIQVRYDPAWTVVHPANGNERLLAVCAVPDGEAWAVGTGGVAVRHLGARWRREASGTTATLADVATDGRLVCAVGSGGVIVVREAGTWRREASGTTGALRAVAVLADGTAWAGGEAGVLLRREAGVGRPAIEPDDAAVTTLAAWGDTLVVGDEAGVVRGLTATGGRELGAFAGSSVLRLAVSPGGTLFAAADSLYRYDGGRWFGLRARPGSILAANDSLVFSGGRELHLDNSGRHVLNSRLGPALGDELAAICPVGPTGALAVGLHGAFAWRSDAGWRPDPDGGGSREVLPLADGTACALFDSRLLVWDGDRWRTAGPLPIVPGDSHWLELLDGLDRSRLLVRVDSDLLWGGEPWQVVPLPQNWLRAVRIDPAGGLVASDYEGLLAWNGQEWRREFANQDASSGSFQLARSRAGDLFAVNAARVLRREEGGWREVARLTGHHYPGTIAVAGRFPDHFALFLTDAWLSWEASADSVQDDWRSYGLAGEYWEMAAWREAVGVVHALDKRRNRVMRLNFGGAGAGAWQPVTGSLPDPVNALWIERDGAITVQTAFGRTWRHPRPDSI